MESLRFLQRRTLQQLMRTRQFQAYPRPLRLQPKTASRTFISTSRPKTGPLPTTSRIPPTYRNALDAFRRTTRGFATATETPTQNLSLSQKLKKLSREYGWTALGVYLLLSALDFPFCFLAVRLLGTDRIGHWEHVIVSNVKEWIKWPLGDDVSNKISDAAGRAKAAVKDRLPVDMMGEHKEKRLLEEGEASTVVDHGYAEANAASTKADASIWTQLVLAYAIHKSFIFIRVPLTAAVLPKVVKTLRSWGYNIGKRPAKKVTTATTTSGASGASGVNTKGSGVKTE